MSFCKSDIRKEKGISGSDGVTLPQHLPSKNGGGSADARNRHMLAAFLGNVVLNTEVCDATKAQLIFYRR
jgi:hypothetical protein